MPFLILILKMGIIMSFITTTQVSFNDERIFSSAKRNTSIGTCGMIARSITIVAPIVNEWSAPLPIVVMFCFSIIGLLTSVTFPNEKEFVPGNPIEEKTYNIKEKNAKGENGSEISYHNLSKDLKDDNKNNLQDEDT